MAEDAKSPNPTQLGVCLDMAPRPSSAMVKAQPREAGDKSHRLWKHFSSEKSQKHAAIFSQGIGGGGFLRLEFGHKWTGEWRAEEGGSLVRHVDH